MEEKSVRLYNIDLLKIICCISVIIIHVTALYLNKRKRVGIFKCI